MKNTYKLLLYFSLSIIILYDALYSILGPVMIYPQMLALGVLIIPVFDYVSGNNHSSLINRLIILAVLFIIYYYFSSSTENGSTILKSCLYCLLAAVPFFVEQFEPRKISKFFWVLSVFCIIALFQKMSSMKVVDENAYGGGYLALVSLPLGLYNLRNSKLQYKITWTIVVFICVFVSLKRGDILACILSIIAYFVSSISTRGTRIRFRYIILIVIAVMAVIVFTNRFVSSSDIAQERVEKTREGNSSNRDIIYAYYWHYFITSSWETKIIGNGFSSTSEIYGMAAHNDWLEIVIDEGLIGISFYLLIMISLLKLIRARNLPNSFRPLYAMIFTIVLTKSLVSMMVFSLPSTILFALAGYMLNPRTIQQEFRLK